MGAWRNSNPARRCCETRCTRIRSGRALPGRDSHARPARPPRSDPLRDGPRRTSGDRSHLHGPCRLGHRRSTNGDRRPRKQIRPDARGKIRGVIRIEVWVRIVPLRGHWPSSCQWYPWYATPNESIGEGSLASSAVYRSRHPVRAGSRRIRLDFQRPQPSRLAHQPDQSPRGHQRVARGRGRDRRPAGQRGQRRDPADRRSVQGLRDFLGDQAGLRVRRRPVPALQR